MRRLAAIGAGVAMALGALAVMVGTQPVRVDPRDAIPSVAAGFTLSVPRLGSQGVRDAAVATEYSIAIS
ncbi:hypothetical protein [Mycolicibacterium aubagnense]|nr:hypothetical protein [Mycolicibacterium aubagnense]TLH61716.1 hypothetical protein C1S80_16020 [Mycolicibacterium aubagnense]WGI35145.1 hypothetical protein QDT91_12820 [Mycolicibacterium aubagnense]